MISGIMLYFEEHNMAADYLTNEELGSVVRGLMKYGETGEDVADLQPAAMIYYRMAKARIDRDAAKYAQLASNGKQGGRPANQTKPNETKAKANETKDKPNETKQEPKQKPNNLTVTLPVTVPLTVTETVTVSDNEVGADAPPTPKRARFVPPTVDEVRAYCAEQGYRVDPERFVAYYDSNGWKVGRNPMKDWKAAVRTWTRTAYDPGGQLKPVHAQQFTQRDYSDSDLDGETSPLLAEALKHVMEV